MRLRRNICDVAAPKPRHRRSFDDPCAATHPPAPAAAADPAEVTVGERPFLETRFAQFFAANLVGSDVNAALAHFDAEFATGADLLAGAANVPADLLLPPAFQLDVTTATDAQILDAVAALVTAYLDQLLLQQDANGEFAGSPFDVFLARNGLPRLPDPGETPLDDSRRLRGLVDLLVNPLFVTAADGAFSHHAQAFQFGPEFTDFQFRNVGVAQAEYEEIHGGGSFGALAIPDLTTRASPTSAPGTSSRTRTFRFRRGP
jgi:hypothetical protein